MWDATFQPAEATVCYCNSETIELEVGEPFVETIKETARDFGYSKFRVFLIENGVEREVMGTEDAPSTITEGLQVKITPYEKAA